MKKIFAIILTLTFAFATVTARPVKRINFSRGATRAVASGVLNGYKDKQVFLLRVRRGQSIRTSQLKSTYSNRYITVAVKSPNGEYVGDSDASCNNQKEIVPTVAGDYRIEVTECRKADAWRGSFKLNVSVK